jgi:hypothetical protein
MGKMALLLVLGFSAIFLVMGYNAMSVSTRAVENMVDYNVNTNAYNIAVSGANMGANEIFMDNKWKTGFSDIDYEGGTLNVTLDVIDAVRNWRKLTSEGTYQGVTKKVEVIFQPSKFSKFAYYSQSEGGTIWWTESDTVWGPFHSQDDLRVHNHPVFCGKTSTQKSLIYYTDENSDSPFFLGGFTDGVNLPLPTDGLVPISQSAQADGLYFTGHDTVYITFDFDSVKIKYSALDKDSALYLPSEASNGVIFTENSVVRLKGTVKGQYSVACSGTGSQGMIYLDDDIVYATNPLTDPSSTDLLGIIAKNSVLITENGPNSSDINIDASIYCEDGGFGADNYKKRGISGNINLIGGIIQNTRKAVGTFDGSGITSGFAKRYKYDERFLLMSPPDFPGTGQLEIVSWKE